MLDTSLVTSNSQGDDSSVLWLSFWPKQCDMKYNHIKIFAAALFSWDNANLSLIWSYMSTLCRVLLSFILTTYVVMLSFMLTTYILILSVTIMVHDVPIQLHMPHIMCSANKFRVPWSDVGLSFMLTLCVVLLSLSILYAVPLTPIFTHFAAGYCSVSDARRLIA